MRPFTWRILLAAIVLLLIPEYEAATPLFLQAITSALSTIPFTGGPMTTGLVGAKLAIGTKLLFYLGKFGRRTSKSKPTAVRAAAKTATKVPPKVLSDGGSFGGPQPVPLPYFLSGMGGGGGGFPMLGGGGGGFPMMGGGGGGGGFPMLGGGGGFPMMGGGGGGGFPIMGGGGGGFPMMGGGFGAQSGFFPQIPPGGGGGADSSQLFEALRAQGYDANTAMQIINYGGYQGGGFGNVPQGFQPTEEMQDIDNVPEKDHPNQQTDADESQGGASEDVESFFTFLKEMDENTCISRLVCDIGQDPSFLGDFSENIHGIVGSLDVQPSSGAFPYIEIMETGKREGGCSARFPECDDPAYEIVKNVAPSVGVPGV